MHSRGCPRTFELDKERRIDVEWEEGTGVPRKIKIRVTSIDQPGILAMIWADFDRPWKHQQRDQREWEASRLALEDWFLRVQTQKVRRNLAKERKQAAAEVAKRKKELAEAFGAEIVGPDGVELHPLALGGSVPTPPAPEQAPKPKQEIAPPAQLKKSLSRV